MELNAPVDDFDDARVPDRQPVAFSPPTLEHAVEERIEEIEVTVQEVDVVDGPRTEFPETWLWDLVLLS